MRQVNKKVISDTTAASRTGPTLDCNQWVSASFHCVFGDATAAGTFKLQASNDVAPAGPDASQFVPLNWIDIPNQSAAITSGSAALLTMNVMAYRWIRPVFTMSASGASGIQVNLFALSV